MKAYSGFSKTGNVVCTIMALDFFSFVIFTFVLGGDGLNGRVIAGRYFLSNHGKLIETTQALFTLSTIQGISLFVLLPFVLCFSLAAAIRRRNHKNDQAAV